MNVLNNQELLKGILYILLVAILVSCFELVFYTQIIVPLEKKILDDKLESLGNLGKLGKLGELNNYNSDEYLKYSPITGYLNTKIERESKLNNKINSDSMIFIIIMIIALTIFSIYISLKIKSIGTFISVGFSSLVTFILIGIFLIMMFFFGQRYIYTTDPELQYLILNKLKNDLNSDEQSTLTPIIPSNPITIPSNPITLSPVIL